LLFVVEVSESEARTRQIKFSLDPWRHQFPVLIENDHARVADRLSDWDTLSLASLIGSWQLVTDTADAGLGWTIQVHDSDVRKVLLKLIRGSGGNFFAADDYRPERLQSCSWAFAANQLRHNHVEN
jgi:hypothetical protein